MIKIKWINNNYQLNKIIIYTTLVCYLNHKHHQIKAICGIYNNLYKQI